MITSRQELIDYLERDADACKHDGLKPRFFGDEIWKFQCSLRHLNYEAYRKDKRLLTKLKYVYWRIKFHHYSVKLGLSISYKAEIGKGLAIVHYGSIVINEAAVIGENCRVHECVCIGATNGNDRAAVIGNNVFIASGAKIIGDVHIANDVAIGANAVVVKDIDLEGTTWGGIPAKLISHKDSHSNMSPRLGLNK